jgi:hypothetical protein
MAFLDLRELPSSVSDRGEPINRTSRQIRALPWPLRRTAGDVTQSLPNTSVMALPSRRDRRPACDVTSGYLASSRSAS